MRDKIAGITGLVGFFLAAGAGGGIECGNATWGTGLGLMALGTGMMLGALAWYKRGRA